MKNVLLVLLAPLVFVSCKNQQEKRQWHLNSPDNAVQADIVLDKNGRLRYEISLASGNQTVQILKQSPLGVHRDDEVFDDGLRLLSVDTGRTIDEAYVLASGKRAENRNHARELVLHLQSEKGSAMDVVFRAYNDGVAFRYVFPGDPGTGKTVTIKKELTGFCLPEGGKAWLQPYDTVSMWTPGYEKYFLNGIAIGEASPNPSGWCFPALFEVNGAWALVSESNVTTSYHGSHIINKAGSSLYEIEKPDSTEAYGMGLSYPSSTLPWALPWRVIVAGTGLNTIVESNLVTHVADAVDEDFSWVKPGRASWSWWSDQASPKRYAALKRFVDFANEMGWEYSLVDANWNDMEGGTLQSLAAYAASKDVGLWAWYNSGGAHNKVTEAPRDLMDDPGKRMAEMQKLRSWGIKGIKVDFFQTDKQFAMEQYLGILRDAAKNQLMVNFHGCTIPRGWARTWPNLLSMESVRGAESYLFASDFPALAPEHNVNLAFTRNVIGGMDYTVTTFSDSRYPHLTTSAHELALSVVFESGIVHYADGIDSYLVQPPAVRRLLKEIPAAWTDVKLLSGYPGRDVVIARKSKNKWFIAGINGEASAKSVRVDLSSLGLSGGKMIVIKDGATPRAFSVTEGKEISDQPLVVDMLPHGGFIVVAQ